MPPPPYIRDNPLIFILFYITASLRRLALALATAASLSISLFFFFLAMRASNCLLPRTKLSCRKHSLFLVSRDFTKLYILSYLTKLEKLLCLKYFGSTCSANSFELLTMKPVPVEFHMTFVSFAGSYSSKYRKNRRLGKCNRDDE